MATYYLVPTFGAGYQSFLTTGYPNNGGYIYTYSAGTSTPTATYTTSTGGIVNPNPIVLGSDGRPPSEIWIPAGTAVKVVVEDSLGNILPNSTFDNLTGINDPSALSLTEWIVYSATPSYVSPTSFSVTGNQTTTFTVNLRLMTTNTGGTVFSSVTAVSYNAGTNLTTVTVTSDTGSLDSGLSAVSYSLLTSTNPSIPAQYPRMEASSSIASAATVNVGAAPTVNITVTGTTTISAFDTVPSGILRIVKFTNSLTITYNATSMVLPGAGDFVVSENEEYAFRSLGSGNWEMVQWGPYFGLTKTAITVNTTLDNSYIGKRIPVNGTSLTITLPATPDRNFNCVIENIGTSNFTLSSGLTNIINMGGSTTAVSSITVPDTGTAANPYNNSSIWVFWDGTNFYVLNISQHGSQRFTANGTWTCPQGVYHIRPHGFTPGGGGGGGLTGTAEGGAGGGGAGTVFEGDWVAVVPGTSYAVSVSGGAGGGASLNGTTGVLTIGAVYSINGGTHGNTGSGSTGGTGGTPGGGPGGTATNGAAGSTLYYIGGSGGALAGSNGGGGGGAGSLWATGGNGGPASGTFGGPGGGGAGFAAGSPGSGNVGGNGGAGLLVIEW